MNDDSIIFLFTPNAEDFMVKHVYKGYWKYLLPDEHINLFSPKSIKLLSEKCGLRIVKTIPFNTFRNNFKGFLLSLLKCLIGGKPTLYQIFRYKNILFKGSLLYLLKKDNQR